MKPKIIVHSLLKGGVGKTSICFNTSCVEAILNPDKKFLLIDFDMQGNLTNYFSIESYEKVGLDSSDMLLGNKTPEEILIKAPIEEIPNLDLIPASFALFQNEMKLKNSAANEYKLQRVFDKHEDFFNNYDYIIIDTNPSLSIYNINVLYTADIIINTVKNSCVSSLKALEMQSGIWNSLKVELDKKKEERNIVIINMHNTTTINSKLFIDSIKANKTLNDITLNNKIRNSVALVGATLHNKPIYLYDKGHRVSKDIIEVVKELEDRKVF